MSNVGFPVCTSDAPHDVKMECQHILSSRGGQGAVAELYDFLVKRKVIPKSMLGMK